MEAEQPDAAVDAPGTEKDASRRPATTLVVTAIVAALVGVIVGFGLSVADEADQKIETEQVAIDLENAQFKVELLTGWVAKYRDTIDQCVSKVADLESARIATTGSEAAQLFRSSKGYFCAIR